MAVDLLIFRQYLERNGFARQDLLLMTVCLRKFIAGGFDSKREFIGHLIDADTDGHVLNASDLAVDIAYSLSGQMGRIEPAGDLISQALQEAEQNSQPAPEPSDRLIELVCGSADRSWFRSSGVLSVCDILETIEEAGRDIDGFGRVLDYGCGCARVIKNFAFLFKEIGWVGADANAEPIAWCRESLPWADFLVCAPGGAVDIPDGSIDAVYALSVYTHLLEDNQRAIRDEMARILKPGGLFIFTTLGHSFLPKINGEERSEFLERGVLAINPEEEGENGCAFFCDERHVRSLENDQMRLILSRPGAASGNGGQDIHVMERRREPIKR